MPRSEDLYRAIDADDVDWIDRLLTMSPDFVNSTDVAPPPIHWAIYRDRREAVETLLNRGADLALRDRDRDATPGPSEQRYMKSHRISPDPSRA